MEGNIRGLKFRNRGVTMSHLLFANDSAMFLETNRAECKVLKDILECYSAASGQLVNHEKSEMCFGSMVDENLQIELSRFFGVRLVDCHEWYLGFPKFAGHYKKEFFTFIKDRVWNKVKGWNNSM